MADRGLSLFGFNAPAWSLFWEYGANIIYAVVLYKIRRNYLLLLTMLSAVAICLVSYRSGNLMGGWNGPTFWDGAARISYSFSVGLLIYRSNWIIKNKLGFIGLAMMLFLPLIMPFLKWNWIVEPFIVLIYFPVLIALGAGARLTSSFEKVCVFSGKISYPLYMTHYAVIWMFGHYYMSHKPGPMQLTFLFITGLIVLVGAAYLVMILFDNPFRKYLTSKRKERLAKQEHLEQVA